MAKKVNVYSGGLASGDGAQVGDIIIDNGVIFQMEEDGLKKLSDIQSSWTNAVRVAKIEEAEAKKEADAEAKAEAKAEKKRN